jgi:hypothetical protein
LFGIVNIGQFFEKEISERFHDESVRGFDETSARAGNDDDPTRAARAGRLSRYSE